MILQPVRRRRAPLDDSAVAIRISTLLLAALLLFGVLVFRLWYLQILSSDQYVIAASSNAQRKIPVEAPRGVIYDRNHLLLVGNRGGLSVGLLRMDMPDPSKNHAALSEEISRLATLLQLPVATVQKAYDQAKTDPYAVKVLKDNVAQTPTVDYLKEHSLEFPGVEVQTSFLRDYPNKTLAAHILGYVGLASQTDLAQSQFANLPRNDHVGKDGVERTYDQYLRGTDGYKTIEVDRAGRPIQYLQDLSPVPGGDLVLTLDSDLQKAAEAALADGINQAHAQNFMAANGGAVVALDPRTGQVLALASYPTYDPSIWAGGVSQQVYAQLTSPQANDPFLDRAIAGRYPAGSTFKPFVAAAALNAGIVTPATTFNCPGKFSVAGTVWKDWNPTPAGQVSLAQALQQSVRRLFL